MAWADLLDYAVLIITFLIVVGETLSPNARKYLAGWYSNLLAGAIDAIGPVLAALSPSLANLSHQLSTAIRTYGPNIEADLKGPLGALAGNNFLGATQALMAAGQSNPDNAVSQAGLALAEAFGSGFGSHVVTMLFEAIFPKKLNSLNGIGPMLAQMAGFGEVVKAIREPLYDAAFGKSAEYHFRSIFKPELPDEADAVTWHSRRLIDDTALRKLFGFSGLKPEYEDPFVKSAYRAIRPNMLAAGFADQDFDPNVVRDAARFMGLRDQDVELTVRAVQVRSLQNVRNSYVQEAMTAYGQGVISDAELNSAFDDAQWGQEARALAFKRALLLRRINLARDAESFIVPEIASGLIADIDGINQLEAAGVQPWKAQMQATKADARAAITQRKKFLSEQAAAAARRRRDLTRAAVAEFQRGVIDNAGLTAALLLIPLDPLEAAAIVAVQDATRQGRQKFLYGKLMTPEQAATLHIQVSAIGDQVKKELLTPDAAVGALRQLGLDDKDVQALVAEWAALRGKPTTTGQYRPV